MIFVDGFVNGVANALGYLAVFTVVFIALLVTWLKLWPRLFQKLMSGINPIMALLPRQPVPTHLCSQCGASMMPGFSYCPNCGIDAAQSAETGRFNVL